MIVTSFSQTGYHEYGKRFLDTFLEQYKEERLLAYYESGIPSNAPKDERITYIDICSFEEFSNFEKRILQSDPVFRGQMKGPEGAPVYNFRLDAFKFFRKVFAITQASKLNDTENQDQYIAWFDADIVFHKPPPDNFLANMIRSDYLAYLGRPSMYSECGFIGFNTHHEKHNSFMELYWNTYISDAFTLLSEWHDCQVFDLVRRQLNCPAKNLAKGILSDHPYVSSILGTFSDHRKGDRKKEDMSPEFKERMDRNEVAGM